ncbi:hypothetical protein [Paenibacillus sp. DYY-L-2]|uniref:hypothetical protein n=1 Tax=Paenibacillus sp. DYY-L-2 TaxID=3447013 RepID=UPI003F508530
MERTFGAGVKIFGDEAGMHIQADFSGVVSTKLNWTETESYGVRVHGFEDYALVKGRNGGKLVLGYGRLNEEEIMEGVERIRRFISACGSDVKDNAKRTVKEI